MPPRFRYSEDDTRWSMIDPALHARGWRGRMVLEEAWVGRVDTLGNRTGGRADYLLQAEIDRSLRAVAVLEAKARHYAPEIGAVQAREYARSANVPFAFATNGKSFVEVDIDTGRVGRHQPLSKFPTPEKLLARHQR